MNVSREDKMQEAIKRMKALGLFNQYIKDFEKTGKVQVTEPPFGALYYVDEAQQEIIDKFEKEHNALVYVVVKAFTSFGVMDSLIFVSDYPEEWEMEWEDLKDGYLMTYTHNYDDPMLSEMGSIVVNRTIAGGLARTA